MVLRNHQHREKIRLVKAKLNVKISRREDDFSVAKDTCQGTFQGSALIELRDNMDSSID